MNEFKELIGIVGYTIEATGVLAMIIGFFLSTIRFLKSIRHMSNSLSYREYRRNLGRSIILSLEFLIAGDIIRTVVVADTLANVAVLGFIILIRTFLGLMLDLEVEGRWPWQDSGEKEKQ
jgi:uncharacterized membrane protein